MRTGAAVAGRIDPAPDAESRAGPGSATPCFSPESLSQNVHSVLNGTPPEDPDSEDAGQALLLRLFEAGRHDLPLGRLVEGHVDAVQIISRYGSDAQREDLQSRLRCGAVFGMWNAEGPDHRLTVSGGRLRGGKTYASGADLLTYALVTSDAGKPGEVQLWLVNLQTMPPLIDTKSWNAKGMARSRTLSVSWPTDRTVRPEPIGQPGDYERRPWFVTGALRFCAVQAGGVAGLLDRVRHILHASDRLGSARQRDRLAGLVHHAAGAADACRRANRALFSADDPETREAAVALARVSVLRHAEAAATLAERAIGVRAGFADSPLGAHLADLRTYLCQPNPDGQIETLGKAAATGDLAVSL